MTTTAMNPETHLAALRAEHAKHTAAQVEAAAKARDAAAKRDSARDYRESEKWRQLAWEAEREAQRITAQIAELEPQIESARLTAEEAVQRGAAEALLQVKEQLARQHALTASRWKEFLAALTHERQLAWTVTTTDAKARGREPAASSFSDLLGGAAWPAAGQALARLVLVPPGDPEFTPMTGNSAVDRVVAEIREAFGVR